jgi:hypothetical protein
MSVRTRRSGWTVAALAAAMVASSGCRGAQPSDGHSGDGAADGAGQTDAARTLTFVRDVFPIVEQNGCASAGCHSDTKAPTAHYSDYRMAAATYQQWTRGIGFEHCLPDGGWTGSPTPEPRIVPGDPDGSLLVRKFLEPREDCGSFHGRMPPPPWPRLTPEQIATIKSWIRGGALYE